jgi:hypothetical protein
MTQIFLGYEKGTNKPIYGDTGTGGLASSSDQYQPYAMDPYWQQVAKGYSWMSPNFLRTCSRSSR